ncbi:hypothetical protein H9Q74_001569 [Fusarium xylarioides]|nr:hypothetical protein H9Q71_001746 [Fusarium xylarioides]KAG5828357.1 hypothetical protein H9Q74_001569 [Fusarium xylarioides]
MTSQPSNSSPRLVRTTHSDNGTSIFVTDTNVTPFQPFGPKGSGFNIFDIQPGGKAPMHRTKSLDYAVVLSGEIVLGLDGGEEKTVKQGEVIVQQGVNHSWENRGDVTCQIIFVMIGAETITLKDGTELEETVF